MCSAHFYDPHNRTSSSAARLTDLAQAAGTSMCTKHRTADNDCSVCRQQCSLPSQQGNAEVSMPRLHTAAAGMSCHGLHAANSSGATAPHIAVANTQPATASPAEASQAQSIPGYNRSCFVVPQHHHSPPADQGNAVNNSMTDDQIHVDEQEEPWLTQQSPSANESYTVTGSRDGQGDNSHSVFTAEGKRGVQQAHTAIFDADEQPGAKDHQVNPKRFRASQSEHVLPKPKLSDNHTYSQALPASRAAADNHTEPQQPQQSERPAGASQKAAGPKGYRYANRTDHRDAGASGHGDAGPTSKGSERRPPRLQSLLMRLIDDFLFITPSRTAAEALVNKLLKGGLLLHQIRASALILVMHRNACEANLVNHPENVLSCTSSQPHSMFRTARTTGKQSESLQMLHEIARLVGRL